MKKLLLTLSLLAVTMGMMAVPAKRGMWSTIKLANGEEVRVEKVGDEHGHWLRAANGMCYVKNAIGLYVQANVDELRAKRLAKYNQRRVKRRAIYASTNDGLGQKGTMSRGAVPSIGSYSIPVVMVQFSDVKFQSTTTVEKMMRYYNEEGYQEDGSAGSVRDYFKAQSGGQFVPTFDVVGIVTLSKEHTYYGKDNSEDEIDVHLDELPGDVIDAAINQLGVNFSQYVVPAGDSYHKAGVPLMAMFYAGRGQATEYSNADNYIWPCEWDDVEDPVAQGTYHNIHFNSFFVGNELYTGGTQLMGMGTFCHEFGHALGLPDFYCTDYSYEEDDAFGMWSIMDTGGYEGDTYAPMGYNAYEKSYMGWLEMKEIGDATEVILQSPLGTAENSAYIIRNSSTETFIFENRQPGTFYPEEYGSGLLVIRIAYSYNQWNNNTLNNTQTKKRACVLTANGEKLDYSASNGNLYGGNKKSISSLKTLNGATQKVNITNIVKNNDGTITLTIGEGGGDDPVTPTGDNLFYESFDDISGTGGNDDQWSGSIANSSLTSLSGWTLEKAYKGKNCIKLGTGSAAGKATTPAIAVNGVAKLTFRAGAWDKSGESTQIKLSATGGTLDKSSVDLTKGKFNTYEVTITGTGNVKVTFESVNTSNNRFFLDDVLVVDPNAATGIQDIQVIKPVNNDRIYTLDGRYVGTDFGQLKRGVYIVNGKKMMK